MIEISHFIRETKVLGPYIRSALWVSGCCFNCPGCIAEEMNTLPPNRYRPEELGEIFSGLMSTEGITISGGEPFLQSDALLTMIKTIRSRRDYGVIVYTGFLYDDLCTKEDENINAFLKEIDILIDGPYRIDLDDGLPFRGSSNQRIILLSERYNDVFEGYYLDNDKRNIEIRFESNRVFMVGVPSQHGLDTWRELKKRAEANVRRN